ncbi:hypothetical protein B296_00024957 [Ensete ventricosum]|uniref:Uncharacterized protein n=1 Tax=Ensete ventricosum TaxID=4639 RepID=A0A426XQM8_ENSVE|nr:hypothetical protein B296_00024957 [Ensete ventricosum]
MWWDLVGSSLGDSSKESGSSLEREGRSPERRPEDLPQDYQRLPEYARNLGDDQLLTDGRYRVVLERFWTKYTNLSVEEDPFVDWPEDANEQVEFNQPFDESVPPED